MEKGVGKIVVVHHQPQSELQELGTFANDLVGLCQSHLELTQYSRLGLLAEYHKLHETIRSASDAVFRTKLISPPNVPKFGSDSPQGPEVYLRWADNSGGGSWRVKAESFRINAQWPLGWEAFMPDLKPIPTDRQVFRVVADIDAFVEASILAGQFRSGEWIADRFHIIQRDSRELLEVLFQ